MVVEEKSRKVNKTLYRIFIILLKYIPIYLITLYLGNIILSYINVNTAILAYLSHFTLFAFMIYISYVCKFCKWHRISIYYLLITDIICMIDEYYFIPISDKEYLNLHLIILGIFIILIIKFRNKC